MNDRYFKARRRMVSQLVNKGIRDPRVLAAMERVPRELFCLPEDQTQAYHDQALPLEHRATLSQPFVVAAMLEALALRGNERALDVGSGSGYTTALLSELCGKVYALEIVPELAWSAAERLRALGYENCETRAGDGWRGWPDKAPFDAVLVSAAVPELPPALLEQLAPGGRLVAPVGDGEQMLRLCQRDAAGGRDHDRDLFPVRFVPLVHGGGERVAE